MNAASKAENVLIYGGGALVLVLLVVWIARRQKEKDAAAGAGERSFSESVGRGAVGIASDVAGGIIQGAGEIIGVPSTDATKCATALNAREFWNSLLYCPAGEFTRGWFGGSAPANNAPPSALLDTPAGADFRGHGATGNW